MAPHATEDLSVDSRFDISDLKAKVVVKDVELEAEPIVPPPVADNFMYDFKYNHTLPTSDVLGISIPHNCDAQKEADSIVSSLSTAMSEGDAESFANLFLDYGKHIIGERHAVH